MSRDKQIEEMARTMCQCSHACIMCPYQSPCRCLTNAEKLTDKGYRKASEVAREIFEEIENICSYFPLFGTLDRLILDIRSLDELKKKYTEGEE